MHSGCDQRRRGARRCGATIVRVRVVRAGIVRAVVPLVRVGVGTPVVALVRVHASRAAFGNGRAVQDGVPEPGERNQDQRQDRSHP